MTINTFSHGLSPGDMELFIKEGLSDSLSVMVVEADESEAMLISLFLRRFGHQVHIANTGEQAVEMFMQIKPDLVFIEVTLPGMNGYETAKVIRAEHKEWVPIIFLSESPEKTERLTALKAGGDDLFLKPIDPSEFLAKMRVMTRVHAMQKQLSQYKTTHEEDDELAAYVMERYLNASYNDPRVEYSILSASHNFSGDAISVAKTPDGGLNVMMLDAMGHGLPAAINVLPAIQAFYSMSRKGMPLEPLVSEINDKVRELSQLGRFLAATFLHLNRSNSNLTGWIGGTPKVYLRSGTETLSFSSRNLSLGVLQSSQVDFEFFNAPWSNNSVLLTCTDGVFESQGTDGNDLGEYWVSNVIKNYGNTLDKALFNKLWKESLAGNKPNDDASVLIINQRNSQR